MNYYEEDTKVRTEIPPKRENPFPTPSDVKIVRPADPAKLKQLKDYRDEIDKRRMKAGIDNPKTSSYGRRNSL